MELYRTGRLGRLEHYGVPLLVALVMALTISVAEEDDPTRSPDALAYLLGLAIAALLLARRRYPLEVLLGSIGLLMVYFSLDYPAFSPALPLAAATFYAAMAGRALPAAVADGGLLLIGIGWRTLGEGTSAFEVVGSDILTDAALLAACLALGEAVRHRRAWVREVEERERQAALRERRESEAELERSRLHTARELHDVLAHTIAGINVQAAVASDYLDDDPGRARAAIEGIRGQARQATGELTASIELLRGERNGDQPVPAPGLDDLPGLVTRLRASGLAVEVDRDGPAELPAAVDLTAYRIVQESLTNVVRHSLAASARVGIRREPGRLLITVEDAGPAGVRSVGERRADLGGGGSGHGLVGMEERALALDGRFSAGPLPDGGFRVEAELPLPEGRP